jgi:hypothetical protein
MARKSKTELQKLMIKYNIKKSWIVVGVIVTIFALALLFGKPKPANADDGYSTLPGWSAGYRYYYDHEDNYKSRVRLFLKNKTIEGNIIKFGWEKQTGVVPNVFRNGTIDGHQLDEVGTFYIEQEFKF